MPTTKKATEEAAANSTEDKKAKFARLANEGVDPNPRIERGVIFPRNKHPNGGFVLLKEDAINCGWRDLQSVKWEQHVTDDGVFDALIFTEMRVCVVSSTPNYVEERKSGGFLGIVDWDTYEHDRDLAKVCQNYLLLLLDENYQPLHKRALHYKAHGNAGLSFTQAFVGSNERQGFYREMDFALKEYLDAEGIPYDDAWVFKTHFNSEHRVAEPYHNCSVIHMKFHAEKRGPADDPKSQSLCCLVEDWDHPTVDNFHEFYRDELKSVIAEMVAEAGNWSRKVLKAKTTFEIMPYVEADLKSAMPDEPPY